MRRKRKYEEVEQRLRCIHNARLHWELIWQDFHQRGEGELFYGNLSPQQFEELPLASKRIGGPAHTYRGEAYEKRYGDSTAVGVYVRTRELDEKGIRYEF